MPNYMVSTCTPIEGLPESTIARFENAVCVSFQYYLLNTSITLERTPFRPIRVPPTSISKYILRIMRYACVSTEAFVIGIIYIRRIIRRTHIHFVNRGTIHRILLAAVSLASKYIDDNPVCFRDIASIGGITTQELSLLECEFLRILQFNLMVEWDEYEGYTTLIDGVGIYLSTDDDDSE